MSAWLHGAPPVALPRDFPSLVLAVLAGSAVLVATAIPRTRPRWRAHPHPASAIGGRSSALRWMVPILGLALVLVAGRREPGIVLVVLTVLGSLADLARRLQRRRRRRRHRTTVSQVLIATEGLRADLQAGLPPVRALAAAARISPALLPVVRAAEVGASVPQALVHQATILEVPALRSIAAAWSLGERSGASLALTLGTVASQLRDQDELQRLVDGEMAAARATAALLAILPIAVMALGSGLGADPGGFLFHSVPGGLCLLLGVGLIHAGFAWLDALETGSTAQVHQ